MNKNRRTPNGMGWQPPMDNGGMDRQMPRQNGGGLGNMPLLEQIRALSFVKVELELFLDTHPGNTKAIDYYHKTIDALEALMAEYQNSVGPIRAEGCMSDDYWNWVDMPWPWQEGNGAPKWGGK